MFELIPYFPDVLIIILLKFDELKSLQYDLIISVFKCVLDDISLIVLFPLFSDSNINAIMPLHLTLI